jgi:hypothetical protein
MNSGTDKYDLLTDKEKQQSTFLLELDRKIKDRNPHTLYAKWVGSIITTALGITTILGLLWVATWLLKALLSMLGVI